MRAPANSIVCGGPHPAITEGFAPSGPAGDEQKRRLLRLPRDAPGGQADIPAQMAAPGQGRPLPVCRQAGSSRPNGTRGKNEPAQARITKHTRHSNTTFTRYESVPRATAGSNR